MRTLTVREGQDIEYTVITQGPGDKIGSGLKEKFGKVMTQLDAVMKGFQTH